MTNGTPDGGLKSLLAHIPVTRFLFFLASLFVVTVVATVAVTALLVNIYGRKQEARVPFVRVVEVDEATSAPEPWGMNWPRQFESYQRTADTARFYGGSSAMPAQKLEDHPWLVRMYAGYAFALDYREARGHAYMLSDQLATRRITERPQPGACLHCHASAIPTYRRLGLEALNLPADAQALAQEFNWPAVQKGFELTCAMSYPDAHAELLKTPDGTETPSAHPVSCVDCHDPETMKSRVSRPGFVRGIAALAAGEAEAPHLPSIDRWRKGDRSRPYDPNLDASRQEMRSFVCAQCHVEYYCGPKETLFFPWDKGLKVEQIESLYEGHQFPNGEAFYDWKHAETGAHAYKAQHPEFEMWSQGIHARSGVGCADCHMPYQREGAMKVSSHWVQSPLHTINNSCQTCHKVPEAELQSRVTTIQNRHKALIAQAAAAMTEMLDAIRAAQAAQVPAEKLAPILVLQRKAQWRLDFVSSENSLGFHADQESARILAESIDFSRQAAFQALALRLPASSEVSQTLSPPASASSVQGVTPQSAAPVTP